MISTKDNLLDSCHPADISWDRFLEDCERAINMSELHSDEWSTDDAFLADEERKNKQKPVGMCYGPTRPVRNGLKDRSLRSSV